MKKLYVVFATVFVASLIVGVNAVPIVWSPYLPFELTAYHTTLQTSQPWTLGSSFVLTASSLTVSGSYMGSATSIRSLTISSVGANLTFNQLSATGETSFTAKADGNTTISFTGFGSAPENAKIGNATLPYTYTQSNDTLTLAPSFVGSEDIVLSYASSSSMDALAIAVVALATGLSLGVVALVFAMRRQKDVEE